MDKTEDLEEQKSVDYKKELLFLKTCCNDFWKQFSCKQRHLHKYAKIIPGQNKKSCNKNFVLGYEAAWSDMQEEFKSIIYRDKLTIIDSYEEQIKSLKEKLHSLNISYQNFRKKPY